MTISLTAAAIIDSTRNSQLSPTDCFTDPSPSVGPIILVVYQTTIKWGRTTSQRTRRRKRRMMIIVILTINTPATPTNPILPIRRVQQTIHLHQRHHRSLFLPLFLLIYPVRRIMIFYWTGLPFENPSKRHSKPPMKVLWSMIQQQ